MLKPGQKAAIVMVTSCGTLRIELVQNKKNPIPNSIAFLVTKHFYDGLTFHRIIADFVLQGGDPKGNGTGGPGYTVDGKVMGGYRYEIGDVAMAKTAAQPSGTAGSQFFVISGASGSPAPHRLRDARTRRRSDVARDDQAHRALRHAVERAVEEDLHLDGETRLGVAYPGPCARWFFSTSHASPPERSPR